jgi:hypothetical protein
MPLPALKNMIAGQPLRKFLLESKLVAGISKHDEALSGKWIRTLSEQIREVRKKVDRVHFKSLGGILALQERIARECCECWSNLPSAEAIYAADVAVTFRTDSPKSGNFSGQAPSNDK